jgi:hypothetical protein
LGPKSWNGASAPATTHPMRSFTGSAAVGAGPDTIKVNNNVQQARTLVI